MKQLFLIVTLFCIIIVFSGCKTQAQTEDKMVENIETLVVECSDLVNGGKFPLRYTGRGDDISPEFIIKNLSPNGKTLAIILDDKNVPFFGTYNHWVIWNIPANEKIPGNIPEGKILTDLGNAMQGIGYGKHKYRGPKPPRGSHHEYIFYIYVLDCELNIKNNSRKKQLLRAIDGHIIQYGTIKGIFE